MPLIDPRTGVVRHEKARVSEGFTLFTTLGKTTTRLIDMDGEVVQEWDLPSEPGNYAVSYTHLTLPTINTV